MKRTKQIKKVQRGQKKLFTEADKIGMVKMYQVDKITLTDIGAYYGTSRQNVKKIIEKINANMHVYKSSTILFDSDEVMKRKKLDIFERTKLVHADAIEVAEMTLALAKLKVRKTLDAVVQSEQDGIDNVASSAIEFDKLTKFLQTAFPYLIEKQNTAKSTKPAAKPGGEKLHKLMSIVPKTNVV